MLCAVRTTLDIADDVLQAARTIAAAEGRSIGEVVSRLARRGLAPGGRVTESGLPTFKVPDDAPPLTAGTVRAALDEG